MIVKERGYACDRIARGDKFIIGNGSYGYRGTLDENDKTQCVALVANGFFDRFEDNWREPVNMPNPLWTKLCVDGVCLTEDMATSHVEKLNLKNGSFTRKTTFVANGKKVQVFSERFFARNGQNLLVSRLKVQCDDAQIVATLGIDCDVWNISGNHFSVAETAPLEVSCITNEGKKLGVKVVAQTHCEAIESGCQNQKVFAKYHAQNTFCVDRFCFLWHEGQQKCVPELPLSYENLLAQNNEFWRNKWKCSRVKISDQNNLQLAMDYSVYQLIACAPSEEGQSISARGLSGQTYKGAAFWDTEMFMIPFYLQTDVETAKRLVRYRIAGLEGAKQKAAEYGFDGAFFPWESQNGQEACSDFNVTDVFTGRPVRTYFRDKQIHISADVAVTLFEVYRQTKDLSLLEQGGAKLLIECALFYWSYAYFNVDKNRLELLDVIGPDEYHERVNNNAYTNYMAHQCAQDCLDAMAVLKAKSPSVYENLRHTYADALRKIRKLKKLLYLPQPNENGVIEQFDGYFKLQNVSVKQVKERLAHPNEYWGGSGGVATPTRVIKQADVVALLCVLPGRFSVKVKQANYDFYLPYTEHGSSLSSSAYARCACAIGRADEAYSLFEQTATTDLRGGGKKFAGKVYIGGSHPAACGGAWITAAEGFASKRDGSALPKQIARLQINTQHGKKIIKNKQLNCAK